jgi:hypothetical protein
MLLNLHKRGWTEGLKLKDFNHEQEGNEKAVKVSFSESDIAGLRAELTVAGNVTPRFVIHQISAGRGYPHARTAQDEACRQARPEAASGGRGRDGDGQCRTAEPGDGAVGGAVRRVNVTCSTLVRSLFFSINAPGTIHEATRKRAWRGYRSPFGPGSYRLNAHTGCSTLSGRKQARIRILGSHPAYPANDGRISLREPCSNPEFSYTL